MAGGSSGFVDEDDALITEINVTPLVDVVLVLLIVLMITMPVIVSVDILNERQMNIALPDAASATPLVETPEALVVNVDGSGNYTVHQEPQTPESLEQLLAKAAADNPERATVLIRADKRCIWQAVVLVMDLCQRSNIRNYRVSTNE